MGLSAITPRCLITPPFQISSVRRLLLVLPRLPSVFHASFLVCMCLPVYLPAKPVCLLALNSVFAYPSICFTQEAVMTLALQLEGVSEFQEKIQFLASACCPAAISSAALMTFEILLALVSSLFSMAQHLLVCASLRL